MNNRLKPLELDISNISYVTSNHTNQSDMTVNIINNNLLEPLSPRTNAVHKFRMVSQNLGINRLARACACPITTISLITRRTWKAITYSEDEPIFAKEKSRLDWSFTRNSEIKLGVPVLFSKKGVYYEGPWNEDIPEGFGKEYYKNGKVRYLGMFKNGEYDGNDVDIFDRHGKLEYKGTIVEGKYEGKGANYKSGHLLFRGYYINGLYEGPGEKFYYNGHKRFKGEFVMGNIVYGKEYDRNGFPVYGGRFKDGTWDGVGEVLGKEALKCKGYSRYGNYSNSKIVGYWNEIGKIKARKFNGFGVSYANNAKITIKYIDFNKREEKIEEHLSF